MKIRNDWVPYDRDPDYYECNSQGFKRVGPRGGLNGQPPGYIMLPDKSCETTPTYCGRGRKNCIKKETCEGIAQRHFGKAAAAGAWDRSVVRAMRAAAILANTGSPARESDLVPEKRRPPPKGESYWSPRLLDADCPFSAGALAFHPQFCPLETHSMAHAGAL